MAQQTTLACYGTSCRLWGSFAGKSQASGKGVGPFTQLIPLGVPGAPYSFSAKSPAEIAKGIGPFTQLAVYACPGAIHSFDAKAAAEITKDYIVYARRRARR